MFISPTLSQPPPSSDTTPQEKKEESGELLQLTKNPFPSDIQAVVTRIENLASRLFSDFKPSDDFSLELSNCISVSTHIKNTTDEKYTLINHSKRISVIVFEKKLFFSFPRFVIGIGGSKTVFFAVELENIEGKHGRGMVATTPNSKDLFKNLRLDIKIQQIIKESLPDTRGFAFCDIHIPPLNPKEGRKLYEKYFENFFTICLGQNCGIPIYDLVRARRSDTTGEKTLDDKDIAFVFKRIAEILTHLHSCKLVHNDVKVQNILASIDGEDVYPYLSDFNLTNRINTPSVCTDFCSPPEYIKGLYLSDVYTDVWGLGVALFECLLKTRVARIADWRKLIMNQQKLDEFLEKCIVDKQKLFVVSSILKVKKKERPVGEKLIELMSSLSVKPKEVI